MVRKSSLAIFVIFACIVLGLGPALASQESSTAQESFKQGVEALRQGNHSQAVAQFTAAIKQDPEMVEAYINRGIAEMQLALWADAVGDFD